MRVVVAPRTRREWKCQGPWMAYPGDALCVARLAAAAALTSRGRGALIVFFAVAVDAPCCMLWDAAALLKLQAGVTTRALDLLLPFASLLLRCSAAFSARMRLRPAVYALFTPCARPTLSMVRSSAYADRVTCSVRWTKVRRGLERRTVIALLRLLPLVGSAPWSRVLCDAVRADAPLLPSPSYATLLR